MWGMVAAVGEAKGITQTLQRLCLCSTVAGLQTTQKRRTAGLLSIVHASYFCAHLGCLVSVRTRYFGKFWLTTCKFEPWVQHGSRSCRSPVFGASQADRKRSPPCEGGGSFFPMSTDLEFFLHNARSLRPSGVVLQVRVVVRVVGPAGGGLVGRLPRRTSRRQKQ